MRTPIAGSRSKEEGAVDGSQSDGQRASLEIQNVRLAEALREAELKLAIETSIARALNLALTRRGMVHDPELL
ncbi:MAG TPA: hypothetical protein VER38_02155 [Candidatus Eisenbacteria bacterium]|nr:hypothetical protein [Candidatus Eisenbacteria bacterium]